MAHVFRKPEKSHESLMGRLEKFKKLNDNGPKKLWSKTGFQVVISAYNAGPWLTKALEGVEGCMEGLNWVLLLANDGSTDDTQELIQHNKKYCTADAFEAHYFKKAKSAAQAKNRIIKQIDDYREDYPAILLCDADDDIHKERARGLMDCAIKRDLKFVIGDYAMESYHPDGWIRTTHQARRSVGTGKFGPWSTLIHESLIPKNGKFFYEELKAHEDLLLWDELKKAGILIGAAVGVETCTYWRRKGSLSFPVEEEDRDKLWKEYKRLRAEVYRL